jgi:hypothetical protein
MKRHLALNEHNRRIGDSHPLARLTDAEVDLVHALLADGMSLSEVARRMDVSKSCIAHIAAGRRRNHVPARFVSVERKP